MIISKKENSKGKKILLVILMIILFGVFLQSEIASKFLESFSNAENSISNSYRQEAIKFFFNEFKENLFFGVGYILPIGGERSYEIVHGYQGYLYTTDVGIIGLMSIMGLIGMIWYLYLIIKLIVKLRCNNFMNNNIRNVGLVSFILMTSSTLIITDSQRILMLPIILAIFENSLSTIDKKD